MLEQPENRKCPACGGKNLADGTLGVQAHTFIPTGRTMWMGYVAKAFVCLDCGFLSHYIGQEDLNEIKHKA
jgi:hypothetical protein